MVAAYNLLKVNSWQIFIQTSSKCDEESLLRSQENTTDWS